MNNYKRYYGASSRKKSKYGNVKATVGEIKFDSKKEARRYQELKIMADNGYISDLELQPRFELVPTIKYKGETLRKASYVADFMYKDIAGNVVVEDTKGFKTKDYILKKKMFLFKYGQEIDFREI